MSGCVLLSPTFLSPPKTKLYSSSCSHFCNTPGRWHRGRKAHPKQACAPGEKESEISHLNGHACSRTEKSNLLLLLLLQYPLYQSLPHLVQSYTAEFFVSVLTFLENHWPCTNPYLKNKRFGLYIITRAE